MTNEADRSYRLDGRVAVVTGAGGGLGRAIAERLGALGAALVLGELRAELTAQTEARLAAAGVPVLALAFDVADDGQVEAAAAAVQARFGRCDVLVNNAAILMPPTPLESVTAEQWDRTLAVNLRGPFLCARHFGADMLRRRAGSIVNVASIAAIQPNASGPYGPAKAALLGLTRQIAVEWGPRGIRANAVSPGLVRTPMSQAFYDDPEINAARVATVASRRIGEPSDIADVIAYLASDAAGYVNGQEILVDGGFAHTALMRLQGKAAQPKSD